MIVKTLKLNSKLEGLVTNCYIGIDEATNKAIVIDPPGETDKIVNELNKLKATLKYIILTHCHVDHICGVNELVEKMGGEIAIGSKESSQVNNEKVSLVFLGNIRYPEIHVSKELDDNEVLMLGETKLEILHTPGHTGGSISIYSKNDNIVFTGDTLFQNTYGRTDLPTGSEIDIINSIKNKLLVLPEETIVYPGHGIETNIKNEKMNFRT